MSQFSVRTARTRVQVLLAVVVGAILGICIGALVILILILNPALPDTIEQKAVSLRYHIAAVLPPPDEPQFVPTPLFQPSAQMTETPSREPVADPTFPATVPSAAATRAPLPRVALTPIQDSVMLRGLKHDYQHWNNCGPTTLEMDLSYFGRSDTQEEIAAFTKPNPDDRNVRPDELAAYVSQTGLHAVVRVGGTLDRLKQLLSNGIPVIVETALVKQPQGWMGHYRLVIGYDAQQFVTMDSYDGPSVKLSPDELDADWEAFDRLYLVVYSDGQAGRVRGILSDALNDQTMYAQAVQAARTEIAANPNDGFAEFNLGTSLNGLRRYAEAAAAFDRARDIGLPWRMLWYQFGPYEAYLKTGRNDEVIALANALLKETDDLEESHYFKGLALRALGREDQARAEFQAALKYNKNFFNQLPCADCPRP